MESTETETKLSPYKSKLVDKLLSKGGFLSDDDKCPQCEYSPILRCFNYCPMCVYSFKEVR